MYPSAAARDALGRETHIGPADPIGGADARRHGLVV
jgi:hypothetical protein